MGFVVFHTAQAIWSNSVLLCSLHSYYYMAHMCDYDRGCITNGEPDRTTLFTITLVPNGCLKLYERPAIGLSVCSNDSSSRRYKVSIHKYDC